MTRTKLLAVALVATAMAGCAAIQERSTANVSENTRLQAGAGDALLKVKTVKNLPNAFGKADVFGRTTPTGLSTVTYHGVRNGKAILVRETLDIETGATTMNSTPLVIPNQTNTSYRGNVGSTSFSGTSTSTGSSTVIPANTSDAFINQRGAVVVEVPKDALPADVLMGDFIITVTDFSSSKLDYSVRRKLPQ